MESFCRSGAVGCRAGFFKGVRRCRSGGYLWLVRWGIFLVFWVLTFMVLMVGLGRKVGLKEVEEV